LEGVTIEFKPEKEKTMFQIRYKKVDLFVRPFGRRGPTFMAEDIDEHDARLLMDDIKNAAYNACRESKRLIQFEPPSMGQDVTPQGKLKVAR
jgi:hypothetical protein